MQQTENKFKTGDRVSYQGKSGVVLSSFIDKEGVPCCHVSVFASNSDPLGSEIYYDQPTLKTVAESDLLLLNERWQVVSQEEVVKTNVVIKLDEKTLFSVHSKPLCVMKVDKKGETFITYVYLVDSEYESMEEACGV